MYSTVLRTKIQLTCPGLDDAFRALWADPELPRLFPAFLVMLHQIMRGSVPLMQVAHTRSIELPASDPIREQLIEYYRVHIDEERDHDLWTLNDLEAIGIEREWVLRQIPPPEVASLVGSQYYWIHHHHPVAMLGYIAVLEGSPPSQEHIARVQRITGLPDEAFRTYEFHGRVDPHHTDALDEALNTLPLTAEQAAIVGMSGTHTGRLLAKCIENIEPLDREVTRVATPQPAVG